jgi:hypothetical protein
LPSQAQKLKNVSNMSPWETRRVDGLMEFERKCKQEEMECKESGLKGGKISNRRLIGTIAN